MSIIALLVLGTLLNWIIQGKTEVHQAYIPQYHKRTPRRMNQRHILEWMCPAVSASTSCSITLHGGV